MTKQLLYKNILICHNPDLVLSTSKSVSVRPHHQLANSLVARHRGITPLITKHPKHDRQLIISSSQPQTQRVTDLIASQTRAIVNRD